MSNEHSPIAENILRFNNFVTGETLFFRGNGTRMVAKCKIPN